MAGVEELTADEADRVVAALLDEAMAGTDLAAVDTQAGRMRLVVMRLSRRADLDLLEPDVDDARVG